VTDAAFIQARKLCHSACQWPSKAARANLPALDDDSHSNLGWQTDYFALVSWPLDEDKRHQLGFSFASQDLLWLVDGVINERIVLAGETSASIREWVDDRLTGVGLQSTVHADMPYELENEEDYSQLARLTEATAALGTWFDYGHRGLEHLVSEFQGAAVITPSVRCWPHHFDLGSLFVLELDDPETARSIGVGLSPGDGSYDTPYFYCSPYPAPDSRSLPSVPVPLVWHQEGFLSIILHSSEIGEDENLNDLLKASFSIARQLV
jgi:hypothetical protein